MKTMDIFDELFEEGAPKPRTACERVIAGENKSSVSGEFQPLAEQLRPQVLEDILGQQHLIGEGKPLSQMIAQRRLQSMILWGPPGVGKTTLAKVLAQAVNAHIEQLSAVSAGVKELRLVFKKAEVFRQTQNRQTLLFIDEIHRFSKSQQDVILPYVEEGLVILIGATTENPSFSLNNAVLSRCVVYTLKTLDDQALHALALKGIAKANTHYDANIQISDQQLSHLVAKADGDGRRLLNLIELIGQFVSVHPNTVLSDDQFASILQTQPLRYDNKGDIFYDQISAFHKSVRGSSPDGALYWLARMINAGCDPLYVARRLLAIASEDIGNADPRALEITLNAWDAFERLGEAEGCRAIAHAAIYCACAPKSNAIEMAFKKALKVAKESVSFPVPDHLCNAPTSLLKALGKGEGYRYAHDEPYAYAAAERYLPDELANQVFYTPTDFGLEQKIKARLQFLKELDQAAQQENKDE